MAALSPVPATAELPESVRDKRRHPRVLVNRPCRLVQPKAAPTAGTIVDISAGGARVRLGRADALPQQLVLVDLTEGLAFEAEIAWRKDTEIGLKFLRRHDLKGLAPAHLLAAKTVWLRDREQPAAQLRPAEPPPSTLARPPAGPPPELPPARPSPAREAASALIQSWRGRLTEEN
jgi:hypothetical protein